MGFSRWTHVYHIKLETGIAWSELDSDKCWGTFQESEMIRRKWLIWWGIETAALSYLRACWKLQNYHPKKTSPLPRFTLKWGSNSSLESYLKVFRVTHAPLQPWPFLNMGFVVSCETVWVAIDFAWEMASLVAPHFFCSIKQRTKKTRRFHPIPVYLLNSSIERPLELTTFV